MLYSTLDKTAEVIGGLASSALSAVGVPYRLQTAGNMFSIFFTDTPVADYETAKTQDVGAFKAFFHALLANGVYVPPSSFEAWFVSAAIDDAALEIIAAALPHAAVAAASARTAASRTAASRTAASRTRRIHRRSEGRMSTETVVHLLRHGEVHNPTKILYGRLPGFRLSPLGEQMAKAAAQALAGHDITLVVSSPLERALQTAEPFAAQFGLTVTRGRAADRERELLRGQAGRCRRRRPARPAQLVGAARPVRSVVGRDLPVPSRSRMHAALLDIRAQAEGHEAVCVSHQLPIWTLRRHLEQKRLWHDPRKRQCGLASLTSFHFDDETLVGIGYREPAAHLVATSPSARTAKGA